MANYNYPGLHMAYPQNSYQQQYAQPTYAAQNVSYQPANTMAGICWVDGEVGAKAQQLPPGWDTSKPYPMWDTNDQIIYLKSFNAMGMPNPLTKLHYTIEEPSRQAPMMSSQANLPACADMGGYVKKEDLEQMKEEIKAMISQKGERSNGKSSV